ncbi:stage II sporulation protein M [Roseomonas sp. USHLN139]|uniref:stage II sporulation protein M n=1 Tax=Roseomonas sp. USHLN139 TaxID=3081298 RepID=UPI003B017EF7
MSDILGDAPPRDIPLRSHRFRREREAEWQRLESLLKLAEAGRWGRLSDDDLLAIPVLYRSAISALSIARATSLDQGLVRYLEALCTRAYFFVYGGRASLGERLGNFLARGWARAVQGMGRELLAALLITLLGAVVAFAMVQADPDWYRSFVPAGLAGGRDPDATAQYLRGTLYDEDKTAADALSVFATYLFTHNARIAIMTFALGFAFCLPTVLLLAYNGAVLGAMVAVFVRKGLGFELGGWLLIHGVTELLAIMLAGAAGLRIGLAVAFPGAESRLHSASLAGRQAATAMGGVVLMLVLAGLLEGFGRQMIQSDLWRYAIAGSTALFWALYLGWPRRDAEGGDA